MSNAFNFMNSYANNIQTLVNILGALETQNQQITDDPTLITRYFQATSPPPRTDIVAADVTNAQNAIVQMLFTFTSGSPTQESFLHKMMP